MIAVSDEEPQVVIATPDDHLLVITVDRDGRAQTHTSLSRNVLVKFLRKYADDIESGRAPAGYPDDPAADVTDASAAIQVRPAPVPIPVGCICAYTWHPAGDDRAVRNGALASCPADHSAIDGAAAR